MTVEDTRHAVFFRDGGCIAPRLDPQAGPCYTRWGKQIEPHKVNWAEGEMDYVRLDAHGPRHSLPEDHVWVCPGHHRGTGPSAGYVWATSHRREERDYLTAFYQAEHGVFA